MGTFLAELAIFIGVIILGVKKSGSLGAVSILGLAIYVFCFGVVPTDPPMKIAILIFAIFFASSALGACGGFHYLTYLSGKAVAKYPKMITFIAPLVSFIFVMLCGSGYIIAALLPMIYDVAKKSGVRPERPITISVIAANQAVLCSPISAPFLALISILTPLGVDIKIIFIVLTISTLCGVIGAAFSVYNMGEDLKPEDFPVDEKSLDDNLLKESFNKKTKIAVLFFLLTVIIIAILGIFENLRPTSIVNGVRTPMDITSMMVILTFSLSAIIIFFCGVKPSKIFEEQTFRMGGNVISSVFGISWISSTFIAFNKAMIISFVSSVGAEHVWIFGVFVFILSIFITSHTAAILTLYPLGLMLGISPLSLLALTPAIDSVFILPSFPTIQVALEVDKTGSTHVGKYLINHSFIRPGMVTVIIGIIVSHLVVHFFFL